MGKGTSIQVLLLECALVVGVVAIIGHSSFNIWEKCVVQKELSRMRSSLYMMKNTVNTISYAYDHLQKDLSHISKLSEEEIYKSSPSYYSSDNYSPQSPQCTDASGGVSKSDIVVGAPSTKSTGVEANVNPDLANQMTMTRNPLKSVGVVKSVEKVEKYTDYSNVPSSIMSETIMGATDTSSDSMYMDPYNRSVFQKNAYDKNIKVMCADADSSSVSEFDPYPRMLDKYYVSNKYGSGDMTEDVHTSVSKIRDNPSETFVEEDFPEINNDDKVDTATSYITSGLYRKPISQKSVQSKDQKHTPIAHFRNRRVQCRDEYDGIIRQ